MSSGPELTPIEKSHAPYFIGIDVGGTSIKLGLVDDQGNTLGWTSIPTEVEQGPDAAVQRMAKAVGEVIDQAGIQATHLKAIGLATPGTMDIPRGMFLQPVNLPGWDNFPVRDRVADATGKPVAFVNDANAAAYGEFWIGGGAEYHSMILLTLGTGVGGGIIIGDLNVEGEHSHGSEVGHIIIDCNEDARVCSCNQTGHLEAYASATAVVKRAREALDAGRESSVRARLEKGDELTAKLLHEEAEAGDDFALEVILETARYLGIGITTLMHTVDPNAVILGGAMTFGENDNPIGQKFLARVQEEVRRRAFPAPAENTVIDYAQIGAFAGYIGAAGIARLMAKRDA